MPKSEKNPLAIKIIGAHLIALFSAVAFATTPATAQKVEQSAESISSQILASLQAEGRTKCAIIEFTDLNGGVTPLGKLIAEELTTELFKQARQLPKGSLTLVERSKLDQVLTEQKLGTQGLLEKRSIEAFARILGVEAILTGTFALFEDRIRINARLIAVPSAELFATAAGDMSKLGIPSSYFQATGQVATNGGPPPPPPPSPTQMVMDAADVQITLQKCVLSGGVVTCALMFKNTGANREVILRGDSRLIDDSGADHTAQYVQLGSKDGSSAKSNLVTNVGVKALVYFSEVAPTSKSAQLLELVVLIAHGFDYPRYYVQFSDVPLLPK